MHTDRRKFLKTSALSGLGLALGTRSFANLSIKQTDQKDDQIALPTFPQMEWQDCEFGAIFHFDISIGTNNIRGDNQTRETFNPKDYDPVKLNTDQWVETAKKAGAKYAVFTATHFDGFLQWQSDLYPYGLKQAKWKNGKGDIVADFIQSCYKYGIKPGLYLSTHRNAYWQVDNHYVDWGKGKGTNKQEQFNLICEKMTEELCSRYGRLLQIWYDAGVKTPAEGGPNVLPIFEKYQPNGIFYSSSKRADIRWVGNEKGHADYPCWATMPGGTQSHNAPGWKKFRSGVPNGAVWSPAMVDFPLRDTNGIHSWFWKPGQEKGIFSIADLKRIHEESVGRNSNMLVGLVINPDGLVPDADAERLVAFGKVLKEQFANPLGNTKDEGNELVIDLKQPATLQQYVLQENIQFGERVRDYVIKGQLANGNWLSLDKGSCIGHKRIAKISHEEKFKKIALKITESQGMPYIRSFCVY